jgi:type I restriction enzyme S subunit
VKSSHFPSKSISEGVVKVDSWNPKASRKTEGFDYVDLSSVDQDRKEIVQTTRTTPGNAPSRAKQLVAAGYIIVSTVRPNLNAVSEVPHGLDGATASTGFCVLRPDRNKLNSRYLYHWVKNEHFVREMVKLARGANYPAVSNRIIKNSLIPFPHLDEQQHIAAILDKADGIRRKRQQAIDLTD